MSYLKLFRKEALKYQYKSHEFGESVIEQPGLLDRALIVLVAVLVLFGLLVLSYPMITSQQYPLTVHDSNFYPLVTPYPVVLEKHLVRDGVAIGMQQSVSKVRFFHPDSREELSRLLRSQQDGYYFGIAAEGSTVEAYQPVAKVLQTAKANIFYFELSSNRELEITTGQKVMIKASNLVATGVIDSMLGPFQGQRFNLGIKLLPPYDVNLLNPSVSAELNLTIERDNILSMLRNN